MKDAKDGTDGKEMKRLDASTSNFNLSTKDLSKGDMSTDSSNPVTSSPILHQSVTASMSDLENQNTMIDPNDDAISWLATDDDYTLSQNKTKLKVLMFLASYKTISITYFVLLLVHLSLWAILGGIDEALSSPGLEARILMWNVSFFEAEIGCVVNTYFVFIIAAESVIYAICLAVALVLYTFSDKDTWGLKREVFISLIIDIFLVIVYVVVSQIPIMGLLMDYIIPYGFSLLTISLVESFNSILLPTLLSIYDDRRKPHQEYGVIEQLLKSKKTFIIILDYARR